MNYTLINGLVELLLPPSNVLVLMLAGLALTWRRPRGARAVCVAALAAFYLLSVPAVGDGLLHWLEPRPADPTRDRSGAAIVVLGGGEYIGAPEYGGDTVNDLTLVRLRYGARLQRELGKPVLVSGGYHIGGKIAEADAMKRVLETEFHVPVRWTEARSSTTLDNARRSFALLNADGIRRVYLVTHAFHLPRARYAFESAGFEIIPAGTYFTTFREIAAGDLIPSARALRRSYLFFHEIIGMAWYRLRVAFGR